MKYTAIAFALFSAIGASASTNTSGTADDRDIIIRNLMDKLDILSAKVEAQDAWRAELASSLKHVKAAGIARPQDKTSVRRNLRQEDEAAVEPLHYDSVLGEILYELVAKVEKIKEAVEDVHECLEYDHISNTCTLGDGSSITSVAIRGGSIDLESTTSGIGLTSAAGIDLDADTNVEIIADLDKGDTVHGFAYVGTGDGDNDSGAGFKASDSSGGAIFPGECSPHCQNGGICSPQDTLGGAICVCPEGFLGKACEETYVTCSDRAINVDANGDGGSGGLGTCTETCDIGSAVYQGSSNSPQFCVFPYPFNSGNLPSFSTGVCVANFDAGVNCGPASTGGTEGVCPNAEEVCVSSSSGYFCVDGGATGTLCKPP